MAPDCEFMLESAADHESAYRLVEGALHVLLPKKLLEGRSISYGTRNTVMTIRGTEFDLSMDKEGTTHLTPYSGVMALTTDNKKSASQKARNSGWAQISLQQTPALPPGSLARVISVKGDVRIKTTDGIVRPAKAGDAMAKGGILETGKDGSALLKLDEDLSAELGPDSEWQASLEGETTHALYALWRGIEHVLGQSSSKNKEHASRFLTPNAVAAVRGTEFELSVSTQGLADVVPLAGSIEITAQAERLNLDKIEPWWRSEP